MADETIKDIKALLLDVLSTNEEIRNKVSIISDKNVLSEIESLCNKQNTRVMKISGMLEQTKTEEKVVENSQVQEVQVADVKEQKSSEEIVPAQQEQVSEETNPNVNVDNDVIVTPPSVSQEENNETVDSETVDNSTPELVPVENKEIVTPDVAPQDENKTIPEVVAKEEIPVPEIPEVATTTQEVSDVSEEVSIPTVSEVSAASDTSDLLMTYVNTGKGEDRALLTSQHQITNLRASKKNQQALFDSISSNQTIESASETSVEEATDTKLENDLVGDTQSEIEKKLAEAERLYKEGNTAEAEKIYNEISELNSKLTEQASTEQTIDEPKMVA